MKVQSGRQAEALALLQQLAGPVGIHASASATTNYRAVFARDAVMAGTAGLLVGDATITAGLVRSLEQLRDLQGPEGQIASNYEHRADGSVAVSFGSLAPRIDSATWYLLGIAFAVRATAVRREDYRASVVAVVRLLDALEYNGRHLLYIPAGGNWADEYIYDGYILYDQVLRAWALQLLSDVYDEPRWRTKAQHIAETITARYRPERGEPTGHPIAAFSPLGRRSVFDLAACSLLALSGLSPQMGGTALAWIDTEFLVAGALPPAFSPVITEGHPDWPALRRYHLHGFKNAPYEYHNGGIWPIWLGWLGLALAREGHSGALERLRGLTAARVAPESAWGFEEFWNGATGLAGGTPQMAYSATGLLMLALAADPTAQRLWAPWPA